MAEGPRRRLKLISTLMIMLVLVIVVQLVHVQIVEHEFFRDWGIEQLKWQEKWAVLDDPPRGAILDCRGNLMAGNALAYAIEAAPASVGSEEAAAEIAAALGPLLHMPPGHIKQMLQGDEPWVQIAPSVSKDVGERVAELGIYAITVRPIWEREYPEGTLAAYALGFCCVEEEKEDGDGDETEKRGFYGVEGYYDGLLRPVPGNAASHLNPWAVAPAVLPRAGTELVLTLDRTVQALAEEELARSLDEYQAESGTVIVMDPRTIELLALVSLPSYDPGRYPELVNDPLPPFEDPAVSKQYEPGSVFKVLTLAAALSAGLVTPETSYNDEGWIEAGGRVIVNASREAYGQQTVADILIKSLNVGAVWLSKLMGPDVFYDYTQRFGIGRLTGVDLAGEVPGQLWLPGDYEHWYDSNLGTNSFGQGVAVTPLQMIVAVATVANDGARLRPHIVAHRRSSDGSVSVHRTVVEDQVISPQTAHTLASLMERVVEEGVPQSKVEGYRVAGKTGTAQIPVPGGYDPQGTIATFIGFGPVPDPEFIILIKLDRPQTSPWAFQTAALSFQRLARRLFVVLRIPPEPVAVAQAGR